jgi:hypothetical protein
MTVNEILLALLKLASVLVLVLLNGFVAAAFALVNTVGPRRPGLHGAGEHHSQMEHAA